jgi:hypothetical protein
MKNLMRYLQFINESMEESEFYVFIRHEGKKSLVCLSKQGNRWLETVESGDKIYGLGRNHIGSKADIIRNLKNNFDDVHEVSEEELLDLI